mgnify:CR=1 FL=1
MGVEIVRRDVVAFLRENGGLPAEVGVDISGEKMAMQRVKDAAEKVVRLAQ